MREKPLPGLYCTERVDGVTCYEPAVIAAASFQCEHCGTDGEYVPWIFGHFCAEHHDLAQDNTTVDCKSGDGAYHGLQYHQVVVGKLGPPLRWVLALA